jgi:CBS domain-containing protein
MVMLSQLLRFHIADAQGRRAQLIDVAINVLDRDYPAVDQLLYRDQGHSARVVPWNAVTAFDREAREARVDDLEAGQKVKAGDWPDAVWMARDVLDAIIINLRHRHVTVANDLSLGGGQHGLHLRAAATGLRAIVPRMTGRFYGLLSRRNLYDWKHIEFLRGDPKLVRDGAHYQRRITRLPPGEIAHLAAPLPFLHAAELVQLLPEPLAADTLESMHIDRQLQIFEELPEERALTLLGLMAPDVAADLLGRLDVDQARRFLDRLPPPKAERLIELLRYPANTVGGAMTNDIVRVPADMTVGKARAAMRERLKEPDFAYFLYVVDDDRQRHLQGVLSLRTFVTADDKRVIGDLMNSHVLKLAPLEAPRQAAHRVLDSGLAALPVVDGEGRVLGVLTVDAAVGLVAPRSWSTQAPRVFS